MGLASLVIRLRIGRRVSLGDGGDPLLKRATRVFGNFAEYAPLVIVLLALAEMLGTSRTWLHFYGAAFLAARLVHAVGLYRTTSPNVLRQAGVTVTFAVLIGLAVTLLAITLSKLG